ncbi:MAG: hypothetical protein ACJ75H_14935 [Thermoanaerobaculia bacterium]
MNNRALAKHLTPDLPNPQDEPVRRMVRQLPDMVKTIGGNLDRALSSLQRIEQKLETVIR